MSLVICNYFPTGIVISADSRTTGTLTNQIPDPQIPNQTLTTVTNFVTSDSTNKVFKLYDRFGVGTFGTATIGNLPIAHHIEQFEHNNVQPVTTNELANSLLGYFRAFAPIPATGFIVAGYDDGEQYVYGVDVMTNTCNRVNFNNQITYGLNYGGDFDIVNRLLSNQTTLPIFELMNVQDGVDFSRHLIRTTIDQMRFEPRFPTVGGHIDTLIITNDTAEYVALKDLRITN